MNQHIIVAVVIIAGGGIINAYHKKKPITTIVVGSYLLLLILSLMDMIGGKMSQLASALAMLAVVYVLIGKDQNGNYLFPWDLIIGLAQGKKA